MPAIKKRNLLRKINYTSFWRNFINGFDFSNIPDIDVLELGNITEAVIILKQIYYALNSDGIDDPSDEAEIDEFDDEEDEVEGQAVGEAAEAAEAAGEAKLPLTKEIIDMLKNIFVRSSDAKSVITLVKDAKEEVESRRSVFLEAANHADKLEEQITQLQESIVTRSKTELVSNMTAKLTTADEELDELRRVLYEAKKSAAKLESDLDEIKGRIVANITEFIRGILDSKQVDPAVKAAIKNIIMRNKLKNILKMGILYKVLTLQQVIIFFRGLEYYILNIVDPSCFKLRKKDPPYEPPDTQELPDSQGGLDNVKRRTHHQLDWTDELAMLADSFVDVEGRRDPDPRAQPNKRRVIATGGGTKRKKSMRSYSRKRRTRKKRRATRRYRRIRN